MVGVLTGSMESGDLEKLLAVPGVLAVEVKHELTSEITVQYECPGWRN
jgi:hypothetical protein